MVSFQPGIEGPAAVNVILGPTRETPRGLHNFAKPDCSQLDAVLAAVKAWPGEAAACVTASATASLDGGSCPGSEVRKTLAVHSCANFGTKGTRATLSFECPF